MTPHPASAHEHWKDRWRRESAWNASELAKLCCGWNPGSGEIPNPAAYNEVLEAILRAVRVGDLLPINLPVGATRDEFFYGAAPLFHLSRAIAWASSRFAAFPYAVDLDSPKASPESRIQSIDADESRERKRRVRYELLNRLQDRLSLSNRKALCDHLDIGLSTLEGIVREESKKAGRKAKMKVLNAIRKHLGEAALASWEPETPGE